MEKQLTYANETTIQAIGDICSTYFSSDIKKKFKEISKKINAKFTFDSQTNLNFLYEYCHNELMKKTNTNQGKTYINSVSSNGGRNFFTNELLRPYISENYHSELDFLREQNFKQFFYQIGNVNGFSKDFDLRPSIQLNDLDSFLNIDNYYDYFENLIGKQSADKEAVKTTERIIKLFDTLLKDVPNKANIFSLIDNYYANGENFRQLHNQLFNVNEGKYNSPTIKEIKI